MKITLYLFKVNAAIVLVAMPINAKERKNSLNEIRFLASIESNHIVCYKEAIYDEDSQYLYLIMEYLAGGDLFNRLKYLNKKNRFLDENFVWLYLI